MLFLERGTSHSGEAHSFSPSELLLCPSSDALGKKEGRPSSSFPSTVEKHAKTTKVILWKVPLSCLLALVDLTLGIG